MNGQIVSGQDFFLFCTFLIFKLKKIHVLLNSDMKPEHLYIRNFKHTVEHFRQVCRFIDKDL